MAQNRVAILSTFAHKETCKQGVTIAMKQQIENKYNVIFVDLAYFVLILSTMNSKGSYMIENRIFESLIFGQFWSDKILLKLRGWDQESQNSANDALRAAQLSAIKYQLQNTHFMAKNDPKLYLKFLHFFAFSGPLLVTRCITPKIIQLGFQKHQ